MNKTICIFGFPRSGSTWFQRCLNTVLGVSIQFEPFYHAREFHKDSPALQHWREPPLTLYWSYVCTPSAPPLLTDAIPGGVQKWLDSQSDWNGFKEVYSGHLVAPFIEGVWKSGRDARVIQLWRRFNGVAMSFAKRGFRWLINGIDRIVAGAEGTELEPLSRCVPLNSDREKLFVAWLMAVYADRKIIHREGGLVLSHRQLCAAKPPDGAWDRVFSHCGLSGNVDLGTWNEVSIGNGPRAQRDVYQDTIEFSRENYEELVRLRKAAAQVADYVEVPAFIEAILDGWP